MSCLQHGRHRHCHGDMWFFHLLPSQHVRVSNPGAGRSNRLYEALGSSIMSVSGFITILFCRYYARRTVSSTDSAAISAHPKKFQLANPKRSEPESSAVHSRRHLRGEGDVDLPHTALSFLLHFPSFAFVALRFELSRRFAVLTSWITHHFVSPSTPWTTHTIQFAHTPHHAVLR